MGEMLTKIQPFGKSNLKMAMGAARTFKGKDSRPRAGPERAVHSCSLPDADDGIAKGPCAYSDAISVLSPIDGALHIVHGTRGCASYSRSISEFSTGETASCNAAHDEIFCTDIGELDVIFGGEKKLARAIRELTQARKPAAVFVYPTCLVDVIGDDTEAVCRSASRELRVPVLPVVSGGRGAESACQALLRLMGTRCRKAKSPYAVNILGDDNIPGDLWSIRSCLEELGIEVIATLTGDSSIKEIQRSHLAGLNLVQCSQTMTALARKMEDAFGIPSRRVDFMGVENVSSAITATAEYFCDPCMIREAERQVSMESWRIRRQLDRYRPRLAGTRAAICAKEASRAVSLMKASQDLGMEMAFVGCRSGGWVERQIVCNSTDGEMVDLEMDTIDLAALLAEKGTEVLIGSCEEEFLAHKLGIPFCNAGMGRAITFEGFDGMVNLARAVDVTVNSPIWRHTPSHCRGTEALSRPTS